MNAYAYINVNVSGSQYKYTCIFISSSKSQINIQIIVCNQSLLNRIIFVHKYAQIYTCISTYICLPDSHWHYVCMCIPCPRNRVPNIYTYVHAPLDGQRSICYPIYIQVCTRSSRYLLISLCLPPLNEMKRFCITRAPTFVAHVKEDVHTNELIHDRVNWCW